MKKQFVVVKELGTKTENGLIISEDFDKKNLETTLSLKVLETTFQLKDDKILMFLNCEQIIKKELTDKERELAKSMVEYATKP